MAPKLFACCRVLCAVVMTAAAEKRRERALHCTRIQSSEEQPVPASGEGIDPQREGG